MSYKIRFLQDKETKNTFRYTEQPDPGKPPIVGTLYVQKWAAMDLGEELFVVIDGISRDDINN